MPDLPDHGSRRAVPRNALIWARGLHAGYQSNAVLHGLDFEIKRHRTTAILGPGGGGKTTLLRILNRQLAPGQVWRLGTLVINQDPMCWLPQKPAVSQRPVSNLFLDLAPEMFLNKPNPEANLNEARDFCANIPVAGPHIADSLLQPLSALDPKWVRVALFAAAVFRKAPFLVLDEPEVDLDPEIQDFRPAGNDIDHASHGFASI